MKTQFKNYLIIVSMAITGFEANAQQASSNNFSLQQAIDYSLKNSPNYLNADLDLKNAQYRRKEITGLGLPQINGSVDLKDYLKIPTSVLSNFVAPATYGVLAQAGIVPNDPIKLSSDGYAPIAAQFGTKYQTTAGFDASQLLFSSDYIVGLKAAKEYINLSKINVQRSKVDLAASVSKAYYNVLVNRERIKLLDINITRLQKLYNDTKALNQQGFVEQIDVERLEVQLNNLKTEKEKTDRLIGLSENLLKFQMGYKIADAISLTDSLSFNNKEVSTLSSGKIDVSKRADYQLLQSQQSLNKLDVKRQKMGYLPTLVAYGAFQYSAQRAQFDIFDGSKTWYNTSLIAAKLNFSVFDGLQRNYRVQQAKVAALKGENNLKNIEMAAELEASVADISYTNAYASLQTQKRNMVLAQHVFDVAQKKFTEGVGSNLEITTAESSLKEAQTNYYNSVYDMLVAEIDYKKATGTLIK
jgi:outer membrane protein TolC